MEKMTLSKVSKKYNVPAKRGAQITFKLPDGDSSPYTLVSCTKEGVLNFRGPFGYKQQAVPNSSLINWVA